MANRHLGAAYITHPVSIAYVTGFYAEPFERLMALVVRPDGGTLIVPAIERQKAAAQVTNAEVVAWRDGEDPYAVVSTALGGSSEIAVEKGHLSLRAAEVITSRTGASELDDVGEEIRRFRLIKHEDEIDKLLRAAAITDAAGDEVFSRMRAGQSEVDVALMIGSVIGKLGGTLSFETLVQSGPNSALPHGKPSSRNLEPGDFVLLDFGAAFQGYKADTNANTPSLLPAQARQAARGRGTGSWAFRRTGGLHAGALGSAGGARPGKREPSHRAGSHRLRGLHRPDSRGRFRRGAGTRLGLPGQGQLQGRGDCQERRRPF